MVSGDGGWAALDRDIAARLARAGLAVVGLDALRYFWKRRDPQQAAAALGRILRHYLAAWDRHEVAVIGYSRGAEVVPFMVDRLAPDLLAKVRLVALLGPSRWRGSSSTSPTGSPTRSGPVPFPSFPKRGASPTAPSSASTATRRRTPSARFSPKHRPA